MKTYYIWGSYLQKCLHWQNGLQKKMFLGKIHKTKVDMEIRQTKLKIREGEGEKEKEIKLTDLPILCVGDGKC